MIQAAEAQFWKSFNHFLTNFGHSYSAVKNLKNFKQYCFSFYGSTLWSLHGKECSKICIAWRKALNLPFATHKRIQPLLYGSAPLHVQLKISL